MSVVPLPDRGAAQFKGVETSFSAGMLTNPLSYVDNQGEENIVIGNTFWGWDTTRWTSDHISLDFGVPFTLSPDGLATGDAWGGARFSGKAFDEDGIGLYGDAFVVIPTGTGLGVSWPRKVVSGEAGLEFQRKGITATGGLGYQSQPDIDLEGYVLNSGPFANASLGYSSDSFALSVVSQGSHNPGGPLLSSFSVGPSVDFYVDKLGIGLSVAKGIVRQPGDPGWSLSFRITAGKGKEDEGEVIAAPVETLPPILAPVAAVAEKCDHTDRIVISPAATESPIVVVVQNIETQGAQKTVSAPKKEPGIGFKSGDAALNDKSKVTLDGVFAVLQLRPAFGVKVIGYADVSEAAVKDVGALSMERAKAAADYLVSRGIDPKRITVLGGADGKPIDTSGTAEGNALNRRVEFVVVSAADLIK
jgi:outer membrane protein OmpA-like peptidoglycan-associated protein